MSTTERLPEAVVGFNLKLTPLDLARLDGSTSPEIQGAVDLLKEGVRISETHEVPLSWGMFAARAVAVAKEKGRLICSKMPMVRCDVTGRRAEQTTPKRKRNGELPWPQDIPFTGIEVKDSFIRVQNTPHLGFDATALPAMMPILRVELRDVVAEIPEALTGEVPRYVMEKVIRHNTCGWEGPEHQAYTSDPLYGANRRGCPHCGAAGEPYGHGREAHTFKITDKTVVTAVADISAYNARVGRGDVRDTIGKARPTMPSAPPLPPGIEDSAQTEERSPIISR